MKKILVIDDEAEIVSLLIRKLVANGYIALPCYKGYDAIGIAHKEKPDLIITDYKMPTGSGIGFYKGLKASSITAAIPVIFMSAYPTDEVKKEALDLGAVDFFMKPLDFDAVLKRVREVFGEYEIR